MAMISRASTRNRQRASSSMTAAGPFATALPVGTKKVLTDPRGAQPPKHAPSDKNIVDAKAGKTVTVARTVGGKRTGETAVIMPESEWDRITGTIDRSRAVDVMAETTRRDREALHQTSNAMVKTWDSTLEGQRLKRLERLKLKADREEANHKRLDLEEAQLQAEKRKEAIAKAREGLMQQTDRVKKFNEALVLSEVLREREAQVDFKKRKEVRKQGMDAQYLRRIEEDRVKALHDEAEKRKKRIAASQQTVDYQLKQMRDRHDKEQEDRRQMLREQLESEKLAEQYFAEQRAFEEKLSADKKEQRRIYDLTLGDKKAAIHQKKLEDELETEEVQRFASAKQKMTKLRKRREREILHTVRERQDAMCQRLHGAALQERDDEDREIAEAQAEKDRQRDQEAKEKQDMYMQRQQEIAEHRERVMEAHEEQLKQEAQRQAELMQQEKLIDRKFHIQQLKEESLRKEKNREFQQAQIGQVHDLLGKQQAEIDEQLKHDERAMEKLGYEENDFKRYATRTIGEAKERGAPTFVLERAVGVAPCGGHGPELTERGGIKPSFLAMDAFGTELKNFGAARTLPHLGPTAQASPKSKPPSFPGNTKKRAGFMW
ncbi:cilia- and flagella- associated protein 210-like [Sycon ciliatum]|uniref:cilia- and flagella- associated protein 210-like n=1 Tax=Sycon ciliatum TaxID=27933 RepID=UPI0031F703C6